MRKPGSGLCHRAVKLGHFFASRLRSADLLTRPHCEARSLPLCGGTVEKATAEIAKQRLHLCVRERASLVSDWRVFALLYSVNLANPCAAPLALCPGDLCAKAGVVSTPFAHRELVLVNHVSPAFELAPSTLPLQVDRANRSSMGFHPRVRR
jgi:hypothetical protein